MSNSNKEFVQVKKKIDFKIKLSKEGHFSVVQKLLTYQQWDYEPAHKQILPLSIFIQVIGMSFKTKDCLKDKIKIRFTLSWEVTTTIKTRYKFMSLKGYKTNGTIVII